MALILPNCPQHVVAFYAVLRLGAVVVEHNPLYTSRELRHQFEDHQARVVIAWDKAAAAVRDFPADVEIDHVVSVNLLEAFPAVKRLALHLPVKKLREVPRRADRPGAGHHAVEGPAQPRPDRPGHPRPSVDDLAAIQYTSGTTGRPKGAMLTHFNLYSNALQGEAWMHGAEYRKEVFYAILPMFHAFGMTLYLTYGIRKQGLLVLFPKFDPDLVLAAMKKSPATVYCAVPPIYERTAMAAKEKGVSLRSCKYCISGAMNLPDHVVELWESVSGGLLVEGYGMTESSPVALGNPFHPTRRTGTIGVPFPSTLMKVVDVDDPAVEVPQGQPGELLIKGPQVFQGYWNNPEETAKTLTADGWLRTGDVVTVDARRLHHHRGPGQGTHHHRRLQRLAHRGGGRAAPAPGRQGRRRRRQAAGARRRDGGRRRRTRTGRRARRGRPPRRTAASTSPATRSPSGSWRSRTCRARCSARSCANRSASRSCRGCEENPCTLRSTSPQAFPVPVIWTWPGSTARNPRSTTRTPTSRSTPTTSTRSSCARTWRSTTRRRSCSCCSATPGPC